MMCDSLHACMVTAYQGLEPHGPGQYTSRQASSTCSGRGGAAGVEREGVAEQQVLCSTRRSRVCRARWRTVVSGLPVRYIGMAICDTASAAWHACMCSLLFILSMTKTCLLLLDTRGQQAKHTRGGVQVKVNSTLPATHHHETGERACVRLHLT
jgi:hypothetical protein